AARLGLGLTEGWMEKMVCANSSTQTHTVNANSLAHAYVARARYYRLGGTRGYRESETLTQALLGAEVIARFAGHGEGPNCLNAALAVPGGGGPDLLFKA